LGAQGAEGEEKGRRQINCPCLRQLTRLREAGDETSCRDTRNHFLGRDGSCVRGLLHRCASGDLCSAKLIQKIICYSRLLIHPETQAPDVSSETHRVGWRSRQNWRSKQVRRRDFHAPAEPRGSMLHHCHGAFRFSTFLVEIVGQISTWLGIFFRLQNFRPRDGTRPEGSLNAAGWQSVLWARTPLSRAARNRRRVDMVPKVRSSILS